MTNACNRRFDESSYRGVLAKSLCLDEYYQPFASAYLISVTSCPTTIARVSGSGQKVEMEMGTQKLDHQGGSSCIPTQTDFEQLNSISGLASGLTRPSPAGIYAPTGWYREYVQHLDLRTHPIARAPKYSEALRQAALEHLSTHDRCISATMRVPGHPGRGTLTAWVRGISGDANIDGRAIVAPWLFRRGPASGGHRTMQWR
jgi:hypothetical protein